VTTRLAAALAATLLALPAAATAAPVARTLPVAGTVRSLGMDGSLVGAGYLSTRPCDSVLAWNVVTGVRTQVSGAATCGDGPTSTGSGVTEVAVAGQRLAWLVNAGGNTEQSERLFSATLPHPAERRNDASLRTGDVDGPSLTGSWLAGLVGDGGLVRYGRWKTSGATTSGARLRSPGGLWGLLPFATGTFVSPQAEDSGQIAALVGDGRIAVLGTNGALHKLFTPARPIAALKCTGRVYGPTSGYLGLRVDRIAFLTTAKTLDVYSTAGAPVHSYPVPAAAANGCLASHVDTYYGYALYAAGKALHVVKLATGKDRVLATATGTLGPFQVDAPGAVYATRSGNASTLHFVPLARLKALVG
jgi:hypothetical protein